MSDGSRFTGTATSILSKAQGRCLADQKVEKRSNGRVAFACVLPKSCRQTQQFPKQSHCTQTKQQRSHVIWVDMSCLQSGYIILSALEKTPTINTLAFLQWSVISTIVVYESAAICSYHHHISMDTSGSSGWICLDAFTPSTPKCSQNFFVWIFVVHQFPYAPRMVY